MDQDRIIYRILIRIIKRILDKKLVRVQVICLDIILARVIDVVLVGFLDETLEEVPDRV